MRAEELKQSDLLFIKLGIEEFDVEPAIKKFELEEAEDYKTCVAEWEQKSKQFLAAKAQQSLKGHSAAEQNRTKMRAEL